jgi:UDP-galactose transporter
MTTANVSEARESQSRLIGMASIGVACFTSGFAAIYFEWVLKKSPGKTQSPHAIWTRNLQLAFFAFSIAIVGVFIKDGDAIDKHGPFRGFDYLTVLMVCLEAFGGIVVALVIKYADTILKNFATAVSIVTSASISYFFFGFQISSLFASGTLCVIAAVWLYTSPLATPKEPVAYAKVHETELDDRKESST